MAQTMKVGLNQAKLEEYRGLKNMEAKKKDRIFMAHLIFFLLLSTAANGFCVSLKSDHSILRSGDTFPSISFPNSFAAEEKKYLGVDNKATLSLGDIQAEVLVIKYLNTNCVYCVKSLPVFNEVFETIAREPGLRRRIKIVAISAGDTPVEVAAFKEQHAVPYPMIPDTEFKAYKAVNEPTVPFIVVTKRDKRGRWVVATVHVGLTFSAESFVGELKAILEIDPDALKKN